MPPTIKHTTVHWVHKLDDYNEARFDVETKSFYIYIHMPLKKEGMLELMTFLDELITYLNEIEQEVSHDNS